MKKITALLSLVFILVSCSSYEVNKENIEWTYKQENRSLNLENKWIENFVNLNEYMSGTEVNNIFLWNNNIQLLDISWFDKLGKLEINNNNIRFISDLKLPKDIRHLNLSNNQFTNMKWLEKYTNLKTLDLSYNKLKDKDIILTWFPRLKYVNIEWNNVSVELLNKVNEFNARYLLNNKKPYSISE